MMIMKLVIRNGEGGLSYIKNNGTSSDSNLIFNVGGSEIHINDVGDLIPNANGSQELGSSSKYWEKIYVNAIEGASTITGTIENADKLDGQHGSFYLDTSSTSQTKSGQLILDTDNQQNGALRILANQTNLAIISILHRELYQHYLGQLRQVVIELKVEFI